MMWPWRKKKPKFVNGLEQALYEMNEIKQRKRDDALDAALYSFREWNNVKKEKEMNDINLTNVKLKKDERGCYLRLKYVQETDNAINEIIIPKFRLPIRTNDLIIRNEGYHDTSIEANIGFGYFPLENGVTEHSDGSEVVYSVKTLKQKVHKMTVADIEKKLGYKIEIVSEESEG